ncbi:hypothetical protein SOVF_178230 [Spinacia oleracea]|nr:hypothetical protein SOVF_178230 [Spinacia oleracea]
MGSKKKKANKSVAGDSAGGSGGGKNGKKKEIQLIEDPRFSMIHTDPKFHSIPVRKNKISIDPRFKEILTDKGFADSSAKVDKRGKPKKLSENVLKRFYHLEDDEDDELKKKKKSVVKKKVEESEDELSGDSSEAESEGDSESDDLGSTTGSDDDSSDGVDLSEDDDDSVEVENVPVIDSETHRLAVVNMDWNQVKAVDIFMMLRSFLPKEGQIKSVTVYPSEFGLKRMEEEAVHGPIALLRYYYAVVECDTIATADYIYKACDGVEFERSSNVLDLRFIPDSMEFPHPPRDVAKEAPVDYEGLDFQTRALQQSNVTLTWDDDEPHRVKTLRRKFNDDQLAELELREFLASDESDEDEDENEDEDEDLSDKINNKASKNTKARMAKKDMYRALVQSGDGSEADEDEGQDMEVTFNTGLEDISKKILEKKDKGSESVWEAYLRKKKEKKKARKYKSKNSSDDESDESDQEPLEQPDDFFEEDPSIVRSKKVTHGKKKREEKKRPLEDEETAATTAELELLLADDKGADKNIKGYKIKQKKGKGKKGKEDPDEDNLPTVDYDDPRFSALFTNSAFSLDPTDPQFKRSATYIRQLAQRQQNDGEDDAAIEPVEQSRPSSNDASSKEDGNSVGKSRKEKFELSSIVKSIKMKSQQLPKPSSVKMKKDKTEHESTKKEKKHKLEGLDRKMKKKPRIVE